MPEVEYPPRECYICQGTRVIPVSSWKGDDVITLEATCVRCQGNGVITDGLNLDHVIDVLAPSRQLAFPTRVCICDFERDGPEGHPNCPAP